MCFGEATTGIKTTNATQTTTPSPWLTSAAANNVNFAQNLQSTGFNPYQGQQVAGFAPQQTQSFGMGSDIANAAQPNVQGGADALSTYLNNAGNQPTVSPETISSQMSPYMNQYVNLALQPQLQQAANAYMLQSQAQQGNATSAGAFGDPREAQAQNNLGLNFALENQGLVGNAYNAAFNTAIGAGAQDVSNNLNAQTTNAGLYNTGLNELLAGSNAGYSQGTGADTLINTQGAQQTAQSQAGLNAAYNQWLMAQQYPFQTSQLLNSDLSAASGVSPTTTTGDSTQTTKAPNNSGWALLGSLLGSAGSAAMGGMTGGMPGEGGGVGGGKADGGDVPSDQPTLIGERGPELFVPHQSGTVIPYERLKAALDNKSSVSTDGLAKGVAVSGMANGGVFGAPTGAPGTSIGPMIMGGGGRAPMPGAPPGAAPPMMMPQQPQPMAPQAPMQGGAPRINPAMMQQLQQFMQNRGGAAQPQNWQQQMQARFGRAA